MPTRRFLLTGVPPRGAIAVAISADCLAGHGIHCQSCADACPVQAITFALRIGGPPLPNVVASRCTLCGDCLDACPANAIHKPAHV